MTSKEFFNKYNNKFIDFDKRYGNQCVDLARQFIKEVLELKQPRGIGSAYQLFTDYEKDPVLNKQFTRIVNSITFLPKEGDIVLWSNKYGPYGHVAVATGKSTLWNFECFSQNDPLKSKCHFKTYSYKHVFGVIRSKVNLEGWINSKSNLNFEDWKRLLTK